MSTVAHSDNKRAFNVRAWPKFLIKRRTQNFYSMFSVVLTIFTPFVGLAMSTYYLFVLDNSNEKSTAAKFATSMALAISVSAVIIGFILHFLLL